MVSLLRQIGSALLTLVFFLAAIVSVICLSAVGALIYSWQNVGTLYDGDRGVLQKLGVTFLAAFVVGWLPWRVRPRLNPPSTGPRSISFRQLALERRIHQFSFVFWSLVI